MPISSSMRAASVHPHVRGDVVYAPCSDPVTGGPPPRAWGRHDGAGLRRRQHGSTPTCVGTSTRAGAIWSPSAVHPHVRGDVAKCSSTADTFRGPPPRAWGRQHRQEPDGPQPRSTPTCVGTSTRTCPSSPATPVHPHVRGDVGAAAETVRSGRGSTPTCVGTLPSKLTPGSPFWVHPHVRGDVAGPARSWCRTVGPPPRAWGRLVNSLPHPGDRRSTPTCVGTSRCRRRPGSGCWVHPHVRGDV